VVGVLRVWMAERRGKPVAGRRCPSYIHRQRMERRLRVAAGGGGHAADAWRARGGRGACAFPPGMGLRSADEAALGLPACQLGRALHHRGTVHLLSPLRPNADTIARWSEPDAPPSSRRLFDSDRRGSSEPRSKAPGSAARSRPLSPPPRSPSATHASARPTGGCHASAASRCQPARSPSSSCQRDGGPEGEAPGGRRRSWRRLIGPLQRRRVHEHP